MGPPMNAHFPEIGLHDSSLPLGAPARPPLLAYSPSGLLVNFAGRIFFPIVTSVADIHEYLLVRLLGFDLA